MTFNYLPSPVFITMTIIISIVLFIYSPKILKSEGKTLGIAFILLGISTLIISANRIIKEYFLEYSVYDDTLTITAIIIALIGIILFYIAAWNKTRTDPRRRKLLLTSIIMLIVIIILTVLLIIAYLTFEK